MEANDDHISEGFQLVNIMYRLRQGLPVTEQEQAQLDHWLQKNNENRSLFNNLLNDQYLAGELKAMKSWNLPAFSAALVKKVQESESRVVPPVRSMNSWLRKFAVAAFILVMAGLSYMLVFKSGKQHAPADAKLSVTKGASDKATLTLADGSVIALDTLADGSISTSGTAVQKKQDQLIYTATGTEAGSNTLTTPKGGKFRIILPDGTKVWMNSASSLTYPTLFTGATRNVSLSGEAYFEVARNSRQPFKVAVQDLEVAVTGTAFNINGYTDEDGILTTLVEGGVLVSRKGVKKMLTPGEQAIAGKTNELLTIGHPDIRQVLSWKEGFFIFDGKLKSEILRELSRWYDIDIEDNSAKGNATFSGVINRNISLEELLELLRESKVLNGTIKGRKLTISP